MPVGNLAEGIEAAAVIVASSTAAKRPLSSDVDVVVGYGRHGKLYKFCPVRSTQGVPVQMAGKSCCQVVTLTGVPVGS